jgi:protein-L-isoaspartate O-methyltransferase
LPVVVIESARDDGFGNGLAALTAHGPRSAVDVNVDVDTAPDGFITMIAAGGRMPRFVNVELGL